MGIIEAGVGGKSVIVQIRLLPAAAGESSLEPREGHFSGDGISFSSIPFFPPRKRRRTFFS